MPDTLIQSAWVQGGFLLLIVVLQTYAIFREWTARRETERSRIEDLKLAIPSAELLKDVLRALAERRPR